MSNARDLSKFLQEGGEVDTDTLVVDSTNNRVGIGTTSPSAPLEVNVSGASDALILTRDTGTNGELQIDFNGANASHNSVQGGHTFATNGTERMRILSSGGITFNGDTAAANALDDYEEGTWTPTLVSGLAIQTLYSARYIKIGNLCTAQLFIAISSNTDGATLEPTLPFTAANNSNVYWAGSIGYNTSGNADQTVLVTPNTNVFTIRVPGSGNTRTYNQYSGNSFIATVTYQTA